jgi:hypothetical protein
MGCYGDGPFDSDTAADFAAALHDCSDTDARHDLLLATMNAFGELWGIALPEYELDSILEEAVAAAAFVADSYTGRHDFTDNAEARGTPEMIAGEYVPGPFLELDQPDQALLSSAVATLSMGLALTESDTSATPWRERVEAIRYAILAHRPG